MTPERVKQSLMLYRFNSNKSQFKSLFETLLKSILAGFMIGLCGLVYLSLENKYIGACLFSFGLLTILVKNYYLYTGKIHLLLDIKKYSEIIAPFLIIIGNFIGSYLIMGKFTQKFLNIPTEIIWENKLSYSLGKLIFMSFLCGVLMYLAVTLWKSTGNPLLVMMPIMIFILTGCEHCVANMFYSGVAGNIANTWKFLLINMLGNTLGSISIYGLEKLKG